MATKWIFTTNTYFLISISVQLNAVDFTHLKLWIMIDHINLVWNIKGLLHYSYRDIGLSKLDFGAKTQFLSGSHSKYLKNIVIYIKLYWRLTVFWLLLTLTTLSWKILSVSHCSISWREFPRQPAEHKSSLHTKMVMWFS